MRFRKGSKIEVLCKKDCPSGAWRSAEILNGNGRNYSVRYDCSHKTERVSRKAIRPCPPLDLSVDMAPGDVVEVFDNFSWKIGQILKGSGKNHFLVRLLGSSLEIVVKKNEIRARKNWQDNRWVVVGKDSGCLEGQKYDESMAVEPDANIGSSSERKGRKMSFNIKTGQMHLKDEENVRDSSMRTQNRSSDHLFDAYFEGTRNIRAEKRCRLDRLNAAAPPELPKNVDILVLPRKTVQEKYLNSLSDRRTGYLDMELNSEKPQRYRLVRICSAESQESDGAESVGSCSIGDKYFPDIDHRGSTGSIDYPSDAESSTDEDVEFEIHKLELQAYRSTMVAFHALGPLSWEKETLISNLRRFLNISDDEHLMVIKNLLSSGNKVSVR